MRRRRPWLWYACNVVYDTRHRFFHREIPRLGIAASIVTCWVDIPVTTEGVEGLSLSWYIRTVISGVAAPGYCCSPPPIFLPLGP